MPLQTPVEENERLAVLRSYGILDTPHEPAFDSIAALAAQLFDVPVAGVTLVDRDRVFVKACSGLDLTEIPRDHTICALALSSPGAIVIEDTHADPRSRDKEVVTGPLGIRFYAGAPLRTASGVTLGSLCVIDREPRAFSERERRVLEGLAALVMDQFELRAAVRRLAPGSDDLRAVADALSVTTGEAFLVSMADCLTRILDVEIAFVSEVSREDELSLLHCTVSERGQAHRQVDYDAAGTPCATVVGGKPRCYPEGVQKAFPEDRWLVEMGVESYAAVPLFDSRGRSLGLLGVMGRKPMGDGEDVIAMLQIFGARAAGEMERLRTERTLRRSQDRTLALVRALPDLVFQVDRDGRFLDWLETSSFPPLVPPEEFLGRSVGEVLPGDLGRAARRHIGAALATGRVQVWEDALGEREFEARLVASGPDEVVVFVRDVTERRDAERSRLDSERRLLQAQKLESLGRLAGDLATEFSDLFSRVLAKAGLALGRTEPGSALDSHLREIEVATRRAFDLAQQMLAVSGRGALAPAPLDLNAVVDEARELLELSVPAGTAVRLERAAGLPLLRADADRLRQALLHLVANASEAMAGRDGVILVRTGRLPADRALLDRAFGGDRCPEGEYLFLEVADRGPGIPDEARPHLCEPFYTTREGARGLGLPAVLGIARAHGGALAVESAVGEGSRFRLLLPLPGNGPAAASEGGTVLVVDDEAAVCKVVARMLETLGRKVLMAGSGREALRILRARREAVDLVLLDLRFRETGGDELVRELQAERPGLRIVFMSGGEESAIPAEAGAPPLLRKPFTIDELSERIG